MRETFSTTKCQDLDPWVVFLSRFTESNQLNAESKPGKFKREIKLVAQSQFKLKVVLWNTIFSNWTEHKFNSEHKMAVRLSNGLLSRLFAADKNRPHKKSASFVFLVVLLIYLMTWIQVDEERLTRAL